MTNTPSRSALGVFARSALGVRTIGGIVYIAGVNMSPNDATASVYTNGTHGFRAFSSGVIDRTWPVVPFSLGSYSVLCMADNSAIINGTEKILSSGVAVPAWGDAITAYIESIWGEYDWPGVSPRGVINQNGKLLIMSQTSREAKISRFFESGLHDSSFPDIESVSNSDFTGGWGQAFAVDSAGRIYARPKLVYRGDSDLKISRYSTDGVLDDTFTQIYTTYDDGYYPVGVQVMASGNVLVCGDFDKRLSVYDSDGELLAIDYGLTEEVSIANTHCYDDDRVLAACGMYGNVPLRRFMADGSADPSFSPPAMNPVSLMHVGPDGKITVASSEMECIIGSGKSLARLNPDGSQDESFALYSEAVGYGTHYYDADQQGYALRSKGRF